MPLLKRILSAFRAAEPEPLPEPDAQLALGALLVQVAMADHDYQAGEIARIDRVLARLYGLGPVEAAKLRATCERLHAAAPDTDTFARLIRESLGMEARQAALVAMWQVVVTDGMVEAQEHAAIERARKALGLSAADSKAARAAAMGG